MVINSAIRHPDLYCWASRHSAHGICSLKPSRHLGSKFNWQNKFLKALKRDTNKIIQMSVSNKMFVSIFYWWLCEERFMLKKRLVYTGTKQNWLVFNANHFKNGFISNFETTAWNLNQLSEMMMTCERAESSSSTKTSLYWVDVGIWSLNSRKSKAKNGQNIVTGHKPLFKASPQAKPTSFCLHLLLGNINMLQLKTSVLFPLSKRPKRWHLRNLCRWGLFHDSLDYYGLSLLHAVIPILSLLRENYIMQ